MTQEREIKLPPLPATVAYIREYARAAIEADRKRRGEPVARATVYELDGRRQVLIVELGTEAAAALVNGVYDLYTAPQPAEPVKVPDHLIERLKKHCEDKSNTAFARSSMREAIQYLSDQTTIEPVKVPSDEELEKVWDHFEAEMARCPTDDELEEFMAQFADEQGNIADDQHGEAARALLARYGDSQPAALAPDIIETLRMCIGPLNLGLSLVQMHPGADGSGEAGKQCLEAIQRVSSLLSASVAARAAKGE